VLLVGGISLVAPLVIEYVENGLRLEMGQTRSQSMAITGLLLLAASFISFCSTLVLHAVTLRARRRPEDG
jgi:hypothetical protein